MKNRKLTALLISCALVVLPAVLSGCEEQQVSLEPTSSVAEPTQAPTEEPPSEPESEVTVSTEPEPTEAPAQTSDFEEVFAENPIDVQLTDDLDIASSSSAILKAYENAGKRWRNMVPLAYDSAMEVLAEDDRTQLEQDQQTWEDTIDEIVAAIQEKNSEGSDGKITASRLIQERYRETVKALCEIYFDNTGELPDFTPVMSCEAKG